MGEHYPQSLNDYNDQNVLEHKSSNYKAKKVKGLGVCLLLKEILASHAKKVAVPEDPPPLMDDRVKLKTECPTLPLKINNKFVPRT